MNTLTRLPLAVAVIIFSVPASSWGQAFSEDFDHLEASTEITTANTNLTYVRIGNQGGSILAEDPSAFSGVSAVVAGPSGGSLNGIGAAATLPASDVYTLSFDIRRQNADGNIVFGAGSGTSFTGDSTFTTSHGLFWYQLQNGNLQHRSGGGWLDTGQWHLAEETNFQLHVVANGSASSVAYAGRTLNSGAMDFYLNGSLIFDGISVTNSLEADGFRIYATNGANFEVDNISLWNSAQPIPEPSAWAAIVGAFALGGAGFLRRRIEAKR